MFPDTLCGRRRQNTVDEFPKIMVDIAKPAGYSAQKRESLPARRCGVLISFRDVEAREVFEAARAEHSGISGKGDLN